MGLRCRVPAERLDNLGDTVKFGVVAPAGDTTDIDSGEEEESDSEVEIGEQKPFFGTEKEDELIAHLAAVPGLIPKPSLAWGTDVGKFDDLLRQRHGDVLQLVWDERKGRVLHSKRSFRGGQHILSDRALILRYVPKDSESQPLWGELERICEEEQLPLAPIWYLAALDAAVSDEALDEAIASLAAAAPLPQASTASAAEPELEAGAPEQELLLATAGPWPAEDARQEPSLGSRSLVQAVRISCLQPPNTVASKRLSLLYRDNQRKPSAAVLAILKSLDLLDCFDPLLVEDRLETLKQNCFACVHPDGRSGIGVWFTASFLSHSCIPNALWVADNDGKFSLMARRPITPGEEFTLSYLDDESLALPAMERRKLLMWSKGFMCMCDRCTGKDSVQPRVCSFCGQIVQFGPSMQARRSGRNACKGILARVMEDIRFASHVLTCAFAAYKHG